MGDTVREVILIIDKSTLSIALQRSDFRLLSPFRKSSLQNAREGLPSIREGKLLIVLGALAPSFHARPETFSWLREDKSEIHQGDNRGGRHSES
jgi:hypothetical protein